MARPPLPIGTWGKIRTYGDATNDRGKVTRYRATTRYRDFDGRTRTVDAYGRTVTDASNKLRQKLKERSERGRGGELTALHRFSAAAEVWMSKFSAMVDDGRRSAGSYETYRRKLDNHILPAMGEIRLGEVTTALLDRIIGAIKTDAGAPTAKTCRSVISGVMGLAVRYGAASTNPVRDVERIEVTRSKSPRALSADEIGAWLRQLQADEKANRRDLPDLSLFMLATGVRIGEALAVMWDQINFDAATVEITHTIIRVKGQGLLRKPTKSKAGERVLGLPRTASAMLRRRFNAGGRLDLPVFPDAIGGFRDPANVRRDIRDARGEDALAWITSHNFRKTTRLSWTPATSRPVRSRTSSGTPGRR